MILELLLRVGYNLNTSQILQEQNHFQFQRMFCFINKLLKFGGLFCNFEMRKVKIKNLVVFFVI